MSSWAKIGIKCLCIDSRPMVDDVPCPLTYGKVYTIAGIYTTKRWLSPPGVNSTGTVLDVGVFNPTDKPGTPPGFGVWRFAPLVSKTQEQDAAMFLDLLACMPVSDRLDELERLLERTP